MNNIEKKKNLFNTYIYKVRWQYLYLFDFFFFLQVLLVLYSFNVPEEVADIDFFNNLYQDQLPHQIVSSKYRRRLQVQIVRLFLSVILQRLVLQQFYLKLIFIIYNCRRGYFGDSRCIQDIDRGFIDPRSDSVRRPWQADIVGVWSTIQKYTKLTLSCGVSASNHSNRLPVLSKTVLSFPARRLLLVLLSKWSFSDPRSNGYGRIALI